MVSDPKLPFAGESPSVTELKAPVESAVPVPIRVARHHSSFARLWARRIGVLVFVFFCATLGVMLMILPWRPEWSENPLLLDYPALHSMMTSGFARGVATGLGALNVWIGFWEAIQYRED
jgi:hypothetical protein